MKAWRWVLTLAIMVASRGASAETGIYVIKATGGGERKVVSVPGMAFHGSPRFSHDGQRIAFDAVAEDEGIRKFYIIKLDGSGLKEMGEQSMPDWSPDDKQLVYHHNGGGGAEQGIYVQSVDGNGREWLTTGSCPRWSPDGSGIAFADSNGLKLFEVANGEVGVLFEAELEEAPHGFDWSRDGKALTFVCRRRGAKTRELFIVQSDAAGVEPRLRLTGKNVLGRDVA
jgi:Tol biopolymer transport system component